MVNNMDKVSYFIKVFFFIKKLDTAKKGIWEKGKRIKWLEE